MVKYGVPYKGSKNTIAEYIIDLLPPAENFYDIFAGGGAITQCAMESGKHKNIYANDIDGRALRLFFLALNGGLKDERRWISRDAFMANRALPLDQQDPYVACCWSFGNNMIDYLYAQAIEPYKKAMHYAVVLDDWEQIYAICPELAPELRNAVCREQNPSGRRKSFGAIVKRAQKKGASTELTPLRRLESLERLQSLERLERLQSLESVEYLRSLERLERNATYMDYHDIEILPNSVIYCDPPYRGTSAYDSKRSHSNLFDHDQFYEWALSQTAPIYISEYNMPSRFICVASVDKVQQLAANTTRVVKENIYVPYHQNSTIQKQLSLFDI